MKASAPGCRNGGNARLLPSGRLFIWTALFLKVRDEGKVVTKALSVAVGVNLQGHKELPGLWLGQQEGAKFRLQILTELQQRGLADILILCLDGLKGLPEAVSSLFPRTAIQTCVVHLVRHSLSFVADKERKAVAADLKLICQATSETEALQALERFQSRWDRKYPVIAKAWRANRNRVKPMFALPAEIRQAVYTTKVIESLNFISRKLLKNRNAFPHDEAVYRLLSLGLEQISQKWTMPIKNWKGALQQFAMLFEDRLPLEVLAQLFS